MSRLPYNQLLVGDAREVLATLPSESVDCVITSPPYFRLRNYQDERQIGLEEHVDEWVRELMLVSRQIMRLLKKTGSFWLNVGDTFSRAASEGATEKSLVLAPERLAVALAADGWILRNKVVWAKSNPMPTSVRDRLSCTHEVVYFLVRDKHYYFDLDTIRVPHVGRPSQPTDVSTAWSVPDEWRGPSSGRHNGLTSLKQRGLVGHPLGKNPGDVWQLATAGYRGQHHAVFPERLVEKPLLATCPEKVCSRCGRPWTKDRARNLGRVAMQAAIAPECDCSAPAQPGLVLDPFMGSGTVASVAAQHGRRWLGVELNPSFVELVTDRLARHEHSPPKVKT